VSLFFLARILVRHVLLKLNRVCEYRDRLPWLFMIGLPGKFAEQVITSAPPD